MGISILAWLSSQDPHIGPRRRTSQLQAKGHFTLISGYELRPLLMTLLLLRSVEQQNKSVFI